MSEDTKLPITVEEFQRARRSAFVAGAAYTTEVGRCTTPGGPHNCERCEAEARRRYPIRRKVPRVVKDSHGVEYRWGPGQYIESRIDPIRADWHAVYGKNSTAVNNERVLLWADLLANPFEEVDE